MYQQQRPGGAPQGQPGMPPQQGYGMPPQGYGMPPQGQPGYGMPPQGQPGYGMPPQGYGMPPRGQPGQPGKPGAPPQGQPGMPPQGYGMPPQGQPGYGMPPQGQGMPPQGYGMPPQGQGMPPQGYGMPPQGYGMPPQGYGMPQPPPMDPVTKLFNTYDKDHSGSISLSELKTLNFEGKTFSWNTVRCIMRVFDREGTGEINRQIFGYMCNFMHQSLEAFNRVAAGKSFIAPPQAIAAAKSQQYDITPEGIKFCLDGIKGNMSAAARNNITFDDYMTIVTQLAFAKTLFQMKDTTNTGKVTLTLADYTLLCAKLM